MYYSSVFINPQRACAARVTVVDLCLCLSVCLFVCLSTTILALQATYALCTRVHNALYEAVYERYQQFLCYKGRKKNVVILLKRLRSRDMV